VSKYGKGPRYENGRSTEKVELMRTQKFHFLHFFENAFGQNDENLKKTNCEKTFGKNANFLTKKKVQKRSN